MLEKVGAWVLNKALGDYVELNTDQLSLGMLSGHLELENLPIKKTALDKLDLPMEVVSGKIGSMSLKVPMNNLLSQPWIIIIRDVHVILGPRILVKPDMEAQKKRTEASKKEMLAEMEEKWTRERQPDSGESGSYTSWFSYYSSPIVSNIVENIQLTLEGFHVRYEGYSRESSSRLAFGVVIDKLVTQSTDSSWKPRYVTKDAIVYKRVSLEGLALYWHNQAEHLQHTKKRMGSKYLPNNYLLRPVSGQLYMKRNTSEQPLQNQNDARLDLQVSFNQVSIRLTDDQYRGISTLIREFEQHEKRKPHLETRPLADVMSSPRKWWHHAIESTTRKIKERNVRLQKEFILQRCLDIVGYVKVYTYHLVGERMSHHDNRLKHRIGTELSFSELKILRVLAVNKVKAHNQWLQKSIPKSDSASSYLSITSWVNWSLGKPAVASASSGTDVDATASHSNTTVDTASSQRSTISESQSYPRLSMTTSERQAIANELDNLKEAIGPLEDMNVESASLFEKDVVFLRAAFQLNQAEFKLTHSASDKKDSDQDLVAVECMDIKSTVTLRPKSHSRSFTLSLGSLQVKDLYSVNSIFPLLIGPRQHSKERYMSGSSWTAPHVPPSHSPSDSPQSKQRRVSSMFFLTLEKRPRAAKEDYVITADTEPLDIVYNDSIVQKISMFFSSRAKLSAEDSQLYLTERARRRYEQLKNKTRIDIRDTWEKLVNSSHGKSPKRVALNLNICAPQILLPDDITDPKTHLIILNLGQVKVNNSGEVKHYDSQESLADVEDFVTPPEFNLDADELRPTTANQEMESGDQQTGEWTNQDHRPGSANQIQFGLTGNDQIDQLGNDASDTFYKKMYDGYEVNITNIQMLTANASDSWRVLAVKGFSHLHIVDRLNVDFLFERRLLPVADPSYPALKLSAVFEKIALHLSETKISRITSCLKRLGSKQQSSASAPVYHSASDQSLGTGAHTVSHSDSRIFTPADTRAVLDNSKMFTSSVDVRMLTLDISGKDRGIISVKVKGTKADLQHLPTEQRLSLKLHSLLVTDVFQSYGRDFDLLLASHRNISLDSESGSMTSSAIASPTSPMSPKSPQSPPVESRLGLPRKQTSATSFQAAVVSGIQNKLLPLATATPIVPRASRHSLASPSASFSTFGDDPLVTIEFIQTREDEIMRRDIQVLFNNLDINANQETMLEVAAFIHRSFPPNPVSKIPTCSDPTPNTTREELIRGDNSELESNSILHQDSLKLEAHFRQLNVALLKPASDGVKRPVRVATVSITGAKVVTSTDDKVDVYGELGSLRMIDLITDIHDDSKKKDKRDGANIVLSFGTVNLCDVNKTAPLEMYKTCLDSTQITEKKAFILNVSKSLNSEEQPVVDVCMGSIKYLHSAVFVKELMSTIAGLMDHIGDTKQKLKEAASDVAGRITRHHLQDVSPVLPVKLNLQIDAPVIMLPCNEEINRMIVAELGNLIVSNTNHFSVTDSQKSASDSISFKLSDVKLVCKDERLSFTDPDEPILENCGVDIRIDYDQEATYADASFPDHFTIELVGEMTPDKAVRRDNFRFEGHVPHSLDISLSRQAFISLQSAIQGFTLDDDKSKSPHPSSTTLLPDSSSNIQSVVESSTETEPTSSLSPNVAVEANFTVPQICMKVKDHLGDHQSTSDIIRISFDQFSASANKPRDSDKLEVKVQLTSLDVLDMLQKPSGPQSSLSNKHQHLIRSVLKPRCDYKSTSLPSSPLRPWMSRMKSSPEPGASSLPNSFTESNIGQRRMQEAYACPVTPPSSPVQSDHPSAKRSADTESNLVSIVVIEHLKGSDANAESNNQLDREITVNFNSLEIVVNQETWVMVLDFFGLGAKVISVEEQQRVNRQIKEDKTQTSSLAAGQTQVDLKVNSLTVFLVKPEYELAKANISDVTATITKTQVSTQLKGHLRDLSVKDLSPHGRLYHDRIVALSTKDNPAFVFDVLKYDLPDTDLLRDFDVSVDLKFVSLLYTHTKRFPIEIINFAQDFVEHHDKIGHMRAATMGQKVPNEPGHAPRIRMKVRADTPIIILPASALSCQAIVMHLGKLSIDNEFLNAGDPGTLGLSHSLRHEVSDHRECNTDIMSQSMHFSADDMMSSSIYLQAEEQLPGVPEFQADPTNTGQDNTIRCLLDVMQVKLTEMDLYSASRIPGKLEGRSTSNHIQLSDYYIARDDSSPLQDKCMLDLVVERNLDNDLSHSSPEVAVRGFLSSVHCSIDGEQYKLVRAVLDLNLGEDLVDLQRVAKQFTHIQTVLTGQVWTVIDMSIDLHNVTVELLDMHGSESTDPKSLGRLDLIRSNLAFVGYSNSSKDIDLVSRRISMTDTSASQSSVHKEILQSSQTRDDPLRLELHLRSGRTFNCATVLFNNTRIICNAEWLVNFQRFLSQEAEKPSIQKRVSAAAASAFDPESTKDQIKDNSVPLEVKLNITGTEFVLVEQLSSPTSRAIILNATTVTHYQPDKPRVLLCNLQDIELFSCMMSNESSTTLSIVDPFNVNIELTDKNLPSPSTSLYNIDMRHSNSPNKRLHVEANITKIAIKFSYNDLKLFENILKALPDQARTALQNEPPPEAAATSQPNKLQPTKPNVGADLNLEYVQVACEQLAVCFINDAVDMDIPLIVVTLKDVLFHQQLEALAHSSTIPGSSHVTFEPTLGGELRLDLLVDYFNRNLSGWEPAMESWSFGLKWDGNPLTDNKIDVKMLSDRMMNVNITAPLIDMIQQTTKLFTQFDSDQPTVTRSEFVPYTIRNDTGRTLWFAVITPSAPLPTNWKEVRPTSSWSFSCEEKSKSRQEASCQSSSHRITVMIQGWTQTEPLTIHRVGQFSRTAHPDPHSSVGKMVSTRFVFDIICQENASKLITVRSPVLIVNETDITIEARLESIVEEDMIMSQVLSPNSVTSIPSAFTFSDVWFRPAGNGSITYSDKPVSCQNPHLETGSHVSVSLSCNRTLEPLQPYRLAAKVEKDRFPHEMLADVCNERPFYQPGHTITLLPPLVIQNNLPVDLIFRLKGETSSVLKVRNGQHLNIHSVDLSREVDLMFSLESFPLPGRLTIQPGVSSEHLVPISLHDTLNRQLLLDARVTRPAMSSVRITLAAPYWLINQTGLPIVFQQVGAQTAAAGQFEENELARSVAPLMFSFSDREQSDFCAMRLGKSVHPGSHSAWCHRFLLKGKSVRRVRVQPADGRPDWVYTIGVEVTQGLGLYQDTLMVKFVPYIRIINRTQYRLAFTQRYLTQQADGDYQVAQLGSSQAYHWPRNDLDQLLCLKILPFEDCMWSGGFKVDQLSSMVINIRRSSTSSSIFLKLETVIDGSTFATIVSEATDLPPPMMVENYTDIQIKCWQAGTSSGHSKTLVRPRSAVKYAWDEPMLSHHLYCSIYCSRGSAEKIYDMDKLGQAENLEYENYFHISVDSSADSLVFDVHGGKDIVLSRKVPGKNSQLWRQNIQGRIIHEDRYDPLLAPMCLDIMDLAPRPTTGLTYLVLRKVDSRRQSTQIWSFEREGRLTCAVRTQCVQLHPSFGGMQEGARVALGPIGSSTEFTAAFTQDRMLPGSGVVSMLINARGPTRVLQIADIHDLENLHFIKLQVERDDCMQRQNESKGDKSRSLEVAVDCKLSRGIGISLINTLPEELLYLTLNNISVKMLHNANEQQMVTLSIRHVQVDNQLDESSVPVIVYTLANRERKSGDKSASAVEFMCVRTLCPPQYENFYSFKSCALKVSSLLLSLDEVLLWKVLEMFQAPEPTLDPDSSALASHLNRDKLDQRSSNRFYFGFLHVLCGQINLSVHTSRKLSPELRRVKRNAGFGVILPQFENAKIDIRPFSQVHPIESLDFLSAALGSHFKEEVQGQAAKIIGSVDLFGNPLGLVNDVTTGISSLVTDGNVGGLLKNVAHGTSNSLAKVAGTLSKGIGWMTMDENHEESREVIRKQYSGSNTFLAGLKGLSHGLMGGLTSIVQQTYDGASRQGIEGAVSGFGKGVVGTVTKPVAGVLDFTSGTATAIRDKSGGGSGIHTLARRRTPRCCVRMQGLLEPFSQSAAKGQQLILDLNSDLGTMPNRNSERYLDMMELNSSGIQFLLSSRQLYILTSDNERHETAGETPWDKIDGCKASYSDLLRKWFISLKMSTLSEARGSSYSSRNPRFECRDQETANRAASLVGLAKSYYTEQQCRVFQPSSCKTLPKH